MHIFTDDRYHKNLMVLQKFSDLMFEVRRDMPMEEAVPLLPFLNKIELTICEGRRSIKQLSKENSKLAAHLIESVTVPMPSPAPILASAGILFYHFIIQFAYDFALLI